MILKTHTGKGYLWPLLEKQNNTEPFSLLKTTTNDIQSQLDSFFLNLKAEVLVSELLAHTDLSWEDIVVLNKSTFERGYRRDVIDTKVNINDKLEIQISRNGIYDALPKGLFHKPVTTKTGLSFSEVRQRSKKEEKEARLLFAPIENEFFYQRVAIEQHEQQVEQELSHTDSSFLIDFWGVKDVVDQTFVMALVKLLPSAHKISRHKTLLAHALSEILKETVRIEKVYLPFTAKASKTTEALVLGANAVLHTETTEELYPHYNIHITLADLKNKPLYEKKGIGMQLIEIFCNYFVPLEIDWSIILEHNTTHPNTTLNTEKAILGLSTTL